MGLIMKKTSGKVNPGVTNMVLKGKNLKIISLSTKLLINFSFLGIFY